MERRTGPLTADQASLSERQPVRTSTHSTPSAIGSSSFGFRAARVMSAVIMPSVIHMRKAPRGSATALLSPDALAPAAVSMGLGSRWRPAKTMYAVPARALTSPILEMSKTCMVKVGS